MASISRRRFYKAVGNTLGTVAISGVAGGFAKPALALDKRNFQSIWLNDPEFIGYMIAIDNGYYDAEGLGVN